MNKTELTSDIVFKGNIKFKKYLKISCSFEGVIDSQDGTLIISEKAKINGQIRSKEIFNYGTIIGDVEVINLLALYKNSYLVGNVKTFKLFIEEDAQFNGHCIMASFDEVQFDKKLKKEEFPLLDNKKTNQETIKPILRND